jgi:hypothetical protein
MTDSFSKFARSLTSPPEHGLEVAPSDADDLPQVTRALYVGGTGDVSLRLKGGAALTLPNVQAGSLLPLRVAQVRATGTTATGLVGLW